MKWRILLLVAFFSLTFISFVQGQGQRLVLLPESMRLVEDGLSSLCIDYDRGEPGSRISELGNPGNTAIADGHQRITARNGGTLPQGTTFYGEKQEAVPLYYKRFIKATIENYKGDDFDAVRFNELQEEVWAYNALDKFGKIDRTAADQVAEFKKKKETFYFDYNTEKTHEAIQSKVSQLRTIKNYDKPIASPTTIEVSQDAISLTVGSEAREITLSYDGVEFKQINTDGIPNDVKKYISIYRRIPETGEFSANAGYQDYYVLTLSSTASYGHYDMNFLVPMNRNTGSIPGKNISTALDQLCFNF